MAHDEYQQQLVQLAALLGWEHLHVRKSIGRRSGGRAWQTTTNRKGWPDLFLWHPRSGGFAAIEVKIHPDKPTHEQDQCLAELAAAGAHVMVAYPEDLERVLRMLDKARGA